MTYKEIKELWNKQADEFNQWDQSSEEEKIDFAYECGFNKGYDVAEENFYE